MIADMETYYANRGNLDKALNVIMVRRDAPGGRCVAKFDPHALMQPDSPMPPPPPGTDLAHGGLIKEERVLDVLGYGARHEGNAEYYVLASFARWLTDPQPLVFEGNSKRLPAGDANSLPSLRSELRKAIPAPPVQSGIAARFKKRPLPSVEGGIRVKMRRGKVQDKQDLNSFLTIIAVHLTPTGGISTGSFLLKGRREGESLAAQFSIPLSLLSPQPQSGNYRLLLFAGDEFSSPVDAQLP
jgi:hypothetical protein